MNYTLDEQNRIASQIGSPKDVARANSVSKSSVMKWRLRHVADDRPVLRYKRFTRDEIQSIIREPGTLAAIGARHGVSGGCIHVWRHQAGLTHINLDHATKLKAAMTSGSPAEVCKLYNVSGCSIREWRVKFGLSNQGLPTERPETRGPDKSKVESLHDLTRSNQQQRKIQ